MPSIAFRVIASNSAAFPPGSQVGGYVDSSGLIELAGLEIERISPASMGRAVLIHTALGYQFTVSMDEYQRMAPNAEFPPG
jgi:hypothetical protein